MKTLARVLIGALLVPVALFLGVRFNARWQDKFEHFYERVTLQQIADRVTAGAPDRQTAVIRLMEYARDRVALPPANRPIGDVKPLEILAAGRGFCDQRANVFIHLARTLPVDSRLVFLRDDKGRSPHSIAQVYLEGEWRIVDPVLGVPFLNRQGKLATFRDLAEEPALLTDARAIQPQKQFGVEQNFVEVAKLYKQDPTIFNSWKGKRKIGLDHCPGPIRRWFVCRVQDLYFQMPISRQDVAREEQRLNRARQYALLFRVKEAERLYRILMEKGETPAIQQDARYFTGCLYESQGRAEEALRWFGLALSCDSAVAGWAPVIHALMGPLYESLGHPAEALECYERSGLAPANPRVAERILLLQQK